MRNENEYDMLDLKEIVTAYYDKYTGDAGTKELAEKRFAVCLKCENRQERELMTLDTSYCTKCGCFIKGKIFTRRSDACPEGKWGPIDAAFIEEKQQKAKKNRQLI